VTEAVRNTQQSSDMAERISIAFRAARLCDGDHASTCFEAGYRAALEASHHAELVGALKRLLACSPPSAAADHAEQTLAKIGGDPGPSSTPIAMDETRVELNCDHCGQPRLRHMEIAGVGRVCPASGFTFSTSKGARIAALEAQLATRPTDPGEDKVGAVAKAISDQADRDWDTLRVRDNWMGYARAAITAMGHTPPSGEDG
jgi:hypothetical protein